jgi:TDG/mug DNA glycosylase family protein
LASKVGLLRPKAVAVLGLGAYRVGFDRPRGSVGEQPEGLCGSRLWALPNPSGAQAYYQLAQLVEQLRALAKAIANDN